MQRPDSRPHLELPENLQPEDPLDPTRLRWIFAGVVVLGLLGVWHVAQSQPGGVLVPEDPMQQDLAAGPSWSRDGYDFHALARYHIRARVLSTDRYYLDPSSAVSPLDLAVGWGPMSDSRALDGISISQRGRFFWWNNWKGELSSSTIVTHAANMHMIPASWGVRFDLMRVGRDDVVVLDGYLVQVTGPHGFHWRSSLVRDDTGDGACEVMWVEHVSTE